MWYVIHFYQKASNGCTRSHHLGDLYVDNLNRMKVGIKKICSSRTFHIFSAKRDTGTSSDLNMVYLRFMRQINDCISEFVMGMGWLPTGQVSDLEITRILFFTFSIILVFIPEKSSRLKLFLAVFLAERFFL